MSFLRHVLLPTITLASAWAYAAAELPAPVYSTATERFWVHYTRAGLPEAKVAAECADDCLARVTARMGLPVEGRIRLYLAASHEELEQLVGGPESFLIEGRALPSQRAIVMRGKVTQEATYAVLAHELAHIALAQRLDREGVSAPRWLDEGLAGLVADEVTPGERRRHPPPAAGGPLPFSALAMAFPREPSQQNLAYAQSRSFVEFLERQMADRGLSRLIQALGDSGSIEEALPAAYGRSLAELEREWAPGFQVSRGRLWALDTGMVIFMAMTVLFVVTMLVRWRRRRAREALEEDEGAAGEPPYWRVPPDFPG